MEIKRFEKIEELNVDKIVAKCDHPYAKSINYATQFFEDSTELIFLFADDNEYDGDLTWIEKYDLFSIKILNHITLRMAIGFMGYISLKTHIQKKEAWRML